MIVYLNNSNNSNSSAINATEAILKLDSVNIRRGCVVDGAEGGGARIVFDVP